MNGIGPNACFTQDEYLLGDSGYMALPHLVSTFKRTDSNPHKEDFNTCIAKCRVTNEHCIGVLKSRWHSLKDIRTQLWSKLESEWMIRWITLCAKLHNFVLRMKDPWTDDDDVIELDLVHDHPPDIERPSRHVTAAVGAALLESVMEIALNFNQACGGFLSPDF